MFKSPPFLKLTNPDPFAAWFAVAGDATPDGIRVVRSVRGAISSLPIVAFREEQSCVGEPETHGRCAHQAGTSEHVTAYEADNALFIRDFARAFVKMVKVAPLALSRPKVDIFALLTQHVNLRIVCKSTDAEPLAAAARSVR